MTTAEIGHLMFVIPACSIVALAVGVCIWCAWDASKTCDEMEKHYGKPNSIKHRVHFFIFMLIVLCMLVGALLSDLS
jgi:hypothetical protein